jgi:RNA polymerase sigma factor (sigma-70 family)
MEVTDDIFQEAFLRFLRADHSKMDEPHMRAYLYCAANSLIIDNWRRHRRQTRDLEALLQQDLLAHDDVADDMEGAFDQLKPQQRCLLWLAYVEDFDHREIAATVGVHEKSVRVLLFRARRAMQDLNCPSESSVIKAVQTATCSDTLLQHVSSCSHCGELVQAAQWMRNLGAVPRWPAPVDPDWLWVQSQFLKEQTRQRRAHRSLLAVETGLIVLVSSCASMLALQWPAAQNILFDVLTVAGGWNISEPFTMSLSSAILVIVVAPLAVAAVTLAIHPLVSGND